VNPWLLLGAVLAAIGLATGVGFWQHDSGVTEERNRNRGVQLEELTAANATIERLNREARATEHAHQNELAAIGAAHEADIETRRVQHDADLAAARAGALKLRDPAARQCPDRGPAPSAAATAGERDGPAPGQLSDAATEFLLGLANDADAVVEQLASCQAAIRTYINPVKGAAP
jgi:prophage endopeptidase